MVKFAHSLFLNLVVVSLVGGCGANSPRPVDPDTDPADAAAVPAKLDSHPGTANGGAGGSGGTGGSAAAGGNGGDGAGKDGGMTGNNDAPAAKDAASTDLGAPPGNGSAGMLEVATGEKVVNECFPITKTSADEVTVEGAPTVASGATLLLWQVQDKFATSGDQTDIAAAAKLKDAGTWELATVASAQGSAIKLAKTPKISYGSDTNGRAAQACTVPGYTDVKVASGAKIVAAPWNGKVGGVVAFTSTGTLTVDGEISATGLGGRGGPWSKTHYHADDGRTMIGLGALDTTMGFGGLKGEGLDGSGFGITKEGKGNFANGAGGGNNTHSGGGGGANAGKGGFGGWQHGNYGSSSDQTRGLGGAKILVPLSERLVMGAGGGQGQQVTISSPPQWCKTAGFAKILNDLTMGGAGGGIVIISAGALKGGGIISADGSRGGCAESDGAGGGGAGGSIFLKGSATGFTGSVTAKGGPGGDNLNTNNNVGPGGGGGGGRVRVEMAAAIKVDVKAGPNGNHYCIANDCNSRASKDKVAWGATAGSDGVSEMP